MLEKLVSEVKALEVLGCSGNHALISKPEVLALTQKIGQDVLTPIMGLMRDVRELKWEGTRSNGYIAGFNDAREMIIALLESTLRVSREGK
jgi:hypothetical protein